MSANRFAVTERVRWSDLDPANIVYFGAYVRFCEVAEMELFRHLGHPFGTIFNTLDIWLPRVEYHMDFKSPATHDDLLRIEIWVGHLGTSSMRLDFEIRRDADRELLATGHVVMVAVERASFRKTPIPAALRESLVRYCDETGSGCDPAR
jgi:YbgC/YbaW family acyl-CoA thioester hydrolase